VPVTVVCTKINLGWKGLTGCWPDIRCSDVGVAQFRVIWLLAKFSGA